MDTKLNYTFDENIILSTVYKKLNSKLGKDVHKLSSLESSVNELKLLQNELEQRLLFATSEAPDKISKAIITAEKNVKEKEKLQNQMKLLQNEVEELQLQEKDLKFAIQNVSSDLNLLEKTEKMNAYQKWISSIEDLSSQIEANLEQNNEEVVLLHYEKLKESAELLIASDCFHLKKYTCEMVHHWEKILLERLKGEFELLLKSIKWPFVSSNSSVNLPTPSDEKVKKLEFLIKYLLQLDLSEEIHTIVRDVEKEESSEDLPSLVSDFNVSSVPVLLLLKPLQVRFFYHFNGEKATSSRTKPEWYLSQILKWVAAHESFIESHIQPILNHCGQSKVNVKIEFIRGLLHLVVVKLHSDIPEIKDDEDLFCQTIQETLNFERELRLGFGYPSSQPTVLNVLTQANVFHNWISIERKFALELMDDFVASPYSWQSEEPGGICHCGEQLILLLQGITDRYKALSQPGHRLQFLELQLELLDDFRVRLLQLTKSELSDPFNSNYFPILNTVHHLVCTISDWADIPFFIEMQYFKENFSSAEEKMRCSDDSLTDDLFIINKSQTTEEDMRISCSAFGSILNLYNHIEVEMMSVISRHVLTEVRARSQSYRKDKWFYTPSESFISSDSSKIIEISPSLCPLLEALVKHLMQLRKKLAPELFSRIWKEMASCLNKFIFEEVILQNNFSDYGANQLNYDMTKAFFPIFGEFTLKPNNYFPLIKEALILLTLPRATALLLKDTLHASKETRDFYNQNASPIKALEESGVFVLSVHDAQCILNIRTNILNL